jgi:agmatine deiminase
MPVQVGADDYVQFRYNPDYLQSAKWLRSISDADSICGAIGITPKKSPIVLDGGNVVRTADKVIMCDKVFAENPHIPEKLLIEELREKFQIDQLFFIPTDPSDKIGHADGMCRFLDDRTVLVNDLCRETPWFQRAFRLALHNAGLDWIEIPYNPYGNQKLIQANGIYINYLQMKGAVIIPTFNMKEDDIAVKRIEQLFPESRIATVDSNEIAVHGGVLNCITWNINKAQTE